MIIVLQLFACSSPDKTDTADTTVYSAVTTSYSPDKDNNESFEYIPVLSDPDITVILDTDIGGDVDDMGALSVLLYYRRMHNIKIGAIINCTSDKYGNGAIDAMLELYGCTDIPIGQYEESGFFAAKNRYNKEIAERFATRFKNDTLKVEQSKKLYTKVLQEAEDNSVVIITVGFFNTVNDAWMQNKELFEKKVKCVVAMGGDFAGGTAEYNITGDLAASKNFIGNYPDNIVFSGMEVGGSVVSGFSALDSNDPLCLSYYLYSGESMSRKSWDPIAVEMAMLGFGTYYSISAPGVIDVDEKGVFRFSGKSCGNRFYTALATDVDETGRRLSDIYKYRFE